MQPTPGHHPANNVDPDWFMGMSITEEPAE
jgi:hypothetical protein